MLTLGQIKGMNWEILLDWEDDVIRHLLKLATTLPS